MPKLSSCDRKRMNSVFDIWMESLFDLQRDSISWTDFTNMFKQDHSDLYGFLEQLLRSFQSRNRGRIAMNDIKRITFNLRKEAPSQFLYRTCRDVKRRHDKQMKESKRLYEKNKCDWYYDQYLRTGVVPEKYPTYSENCGPYYRHNYVVQSLDTPEKLEERYIILLTNENY